MRNYATLHSLVFLTDFRGLHAVQVSHARGRQLAGEMSSQSKTVRGFAATSWVER